ncbi:MAG TPA: hypothetical protein VK188_13660 [Holophaga sp.]|nr:hypothetical protein [Holophaga sp.]
MPAKGYHYVLKNATVVLWQRDSLKMVPDSTTKSLGPSGTPSASRIQMFEAGLTGPFKSVPAVINLRGDGSTAGTKCKDFDDLKTRVKAALSKPEKDGLEEFIFPRVELTAGSLKGEVIYLVQTYFLADPKAQ